MKSTDFRTIDGKLTTILNLTTCLVVLIEMTVEMRLCYQAAMRAMDGVTDTMYENHALEQSVHVHKTQGKANHRWCT